MRQFPETHGIFLPALGIYPFFSLSIRLPCGLIFQRGHLPNAARAIGGLATLPLRSMRLPHPVLRQYSRLVLAAPEGKVPFLSSAHQWDLPGSRTGHGGRGAGNDLHDSQP